MGYFAISLRYFKTKLRLPEPIKAGHKKSKDHLEGKLLGELRFTTAYGSCNGQVIL
jgi:hypothetical protein